MQGGDTIHEERFEDSEQNTKRESTQNKQSTATLIQVASQDFLNLGAQYNPAKQVISDNASQQQPQKSKSLISIPA